MSHALRSFLIHLRPYWASITLCAVTIGITASPAAQVRTLTFLAEADLRAGESYDAWVEFKDKGAADPQQRRAMVAKLKADCDPRALARRRAKRHLPELFDERDYPIPSTYLQNIKDTGARVQVQSRWLNGTTIIGTKSQIDRIKLLACVKKASDFHLRHARAKATPQGAGAARGPALPVSAYGHSSGQITRLNLRPLHSAGYAGRGVLIAVIDCGFDLSHAAFTNPKHPLRIAAQKDLVENDDDVRAGPDASPSNYAHGTWVLGAIAAYLPDVLMGTAYDADFILCNAEDGEEEYYLEERWFVAALEFAEARGADVVTSSLVLYGGYSPRQADGKTSVMTQGINTATDNGVLCLVGAGNDGHDQDPALSHLVPPGDAVEAITVGAVNGNGAPASFTSDGPTADGRLKPEVLAPGVDVATVSLGDPLGHSFVSGTSMATPLMAGAAACLLQVHPEWTSKELRAALFQSGDYFRSNARPDPLFISGFGLPDLQLASGLKSSWLKRDDERR